jgi:T-complex protein 1 subunit alpha
LIIPKMLAVNAAQDATDLVAKLRAYHNSAQTTEGKKEYSMYALPQSLRVSLVVSLAQT